MDGSLITVVSVSVMYVQILFFITEAVIRMCSVKKVFLEISESSQKKTCARLSFLIKLQAIGLFLKNTPSGCFCY